MRHRKAGRHLGRDSAHRRSLYRNLVTDLLRYERITTTDAKAREIRPLAEKMITLGRRGDLHARRQALRYIYDRYVVEKVFDELGLRMAERPGGYLRISRLEPRKGDGAMMAVIETVDYHEAAEAAAVAAAGDDADGATDADEPDELDETVAEVEEDDLASAETEDGAADDPSDDASASDEDGDDAGGEER